MEGGSTSIYKGLRGYWKRKDYVRLDGSGRRGKRHLEVAELGAGQSRRRRFWRIRPKLRFRVGSPKRFFTRLRDAYVKMMLSFANSRVFSAGYGGADAGFGLGYRYGPGMGIGGPQLKEYDEKVIVEIYKSLMVAQGHLVPRDAGAIGNDVVCRL